MATTGAEAGQGRGEEQEGRGLGARAAAKARQLFPKIPDIGQIQRMMDERFGQLLDKLDEIKGVLERIDGKIGPGTGV